MTRIWSEISATTPRSPDRKSTRLNSSHLVISYAVFCLKKKKMVRKLISPANSVSPHWIGHSPKSSLPLPPIRSSLYTHHTKRLTPFQSPSTFTSLLVVHQCLP